MISPEYCQLLARYNRWMNERMYAAASALSDEDRKRDRGAFFGSIHRTLNHILWGDRMWIGRFTGDAYNVAPYGADLHDDFAELARERELTDTRILDWAGKVSPAWLAGVLVYRASNGMQRELPAWVAAVHLFQHAVHHRGQVTTLLKQAGHDMGPTDLPALPGACKTTG